MIQNHDQLRVCTLCAFSFSVPHSHSSSTLRRSDEGRDSRCAQENERKLSLRLSFASVGPVLLCPTLVRDHMCHVSPSAVPVPGLGCKFVDKSRRPSLPFKFPTRASSLISISIFRCVFTSQQRTTKPRLAGCGQTTAASVSSLCAQSSSRAVESHANLSWLCS